MKRLSLAHVSSFTGFRLACQCKSLQKKNFVCCVWAAFLNLDGFFFRLSRT